MNAKGHSHDWNVDASNLKTCQTPAEGRPEGAQKHLRSPKFTHDKSFRGGTEFGGETFLGGIASNIRAGLRGVGMKTKHLKKGQFSDY